MPARPTRPVSGARRRCGEEGAGPPPLVPTPHRPETPGCWVPAWTEPLSAGGSRGTKADTWSTTQTWCFPLKEAAWRPVAPMLKARTNHASTALNGEVYAIGGEGPPGTPPGPPAARLSPLPPLCLLGPLGPRQWLQGPRWPWELTAGVEGSRPGRASPHLGCAACYLDVLRGSGTQDPAPGDSDSLWGHREQDDESVPRRGPVRSGGLELPGEMTGHFRPRASGPSSGSPPR